VGAVYAHGAVMWPPIQHHYEGSRVVTGAEQAKVDPAEQTTREP